MTSIYMLTLFGTPFYVGKTNNIKSRLYAHLNSINKGWSPIYSAVSSNMKMEVIAKVGPLDASKEEEFWTNQLKAWGFPLVNSNFLHKQKKTSYRMFFIPEKISILIEKKRRHGDLLKLANLLGISSENVGKLIKGKKKLNIDNLRVIVKFYKL